ncbi:hypothetical protein AAF712_005267 [Marasmius tenuissimus]|uniref:Uncharacterized protein n=1 Tax=Marasmius tenuissimus TaxID=585030 RepID=A0ABR3A2H3_9AGAR
MDLPSTRELELETLLRDRDKQIAELGDQLTRLRAYLPTSSATPSTSDSVTLPPALTALLLPHINSQNLPSHQGGGGSTVAALTQRVKLLQEENDQLYDVLKEGETGMLKEEVQSLRRLVGRLEGALKESHHTISNLSNELEKSYDAFSVYSTTHHQTTQNHHNHHKSSSSSTTAAANHQNRNNRLPPTGPRAHINKKPRLSGSPRRPITNASANLTVNTNSGSGQRLRSRSPRPNHGNSHNNNMDVDSSARDEKDNRSRSPLNPRKGGGGGGRRGGGERDKDRDRARDKDRDRDRNRERDWDKESVRSHGHKERGDREKEKDRDRNRSRRSAGGEGRGHHSHGNHNNGGSSVDRTLAERMGIGS